MMATMNMGSDINDGFSILELTISIVIAVILFAGVAGMASETMVFSRYTDDNFVVRFEAERAFDRLSEILRKTGWNTDAGNTTYPQVILGGGEFHFRILEDADGNGYPYDQTTGNLEWSPVVYTIGLDTEERTLYVYQDSNPVWTLGRHIDSVEFETVTQDPAIYFQEVRVTIQASRVNSENITVQHTATGSIHMRN